jgi:site-specific DNA recombinase
VPIGYEPKDRTLVINEVEAEAVRTIYRRYLELKSVDALKTELDRGGFRTKLRPGKSERMVGGHSFSRGHLYRILSNPLYTGEIDHKGQRYPGQHPAIIDPATWDAVQEQLARNGHERLVKAHMNSATPREVTCTLSTVTATMTSRACPNWLNRFCAFLSL